MKKLVLILIINVIVFTICIGQIDSIDKKYQIVNQNSSCPEDSTLTTNEIIQGNATEGEVVVTCSEIIQGNATEGEEISPCGEIIQGNRKEHLLELKKDPPLDSLQYEINKFPKSETNPKNLFSPPEPVNLIGESTKKNLPSNDNDLPKINIKSKHDPISGTRDWITIKLETFEGSFPNTLWQCYAASGPDAYWDDQSYLSHNGNWSAWCADGGSQGLPASGGQYLDNMHAVMKYGPFDLSDASDAQVLFYYWLDSEYNYDYLQWFASVDNNNWYGNQISGNSGGWTPYNFDLTDVYIIGDLTGEPQVWVKWQFISDGSIHNYMGAYVDDILIEKDVSPGNVNLDLTGGSFSPNPCAIDADLTIDAEITNNGTAPANNVLIEYYLSENTIISQSDYLVGSDYVTLSPGQSGWEHITENLSNVSGLTPGFYYVGIYMDAQGPNGGYWYWTTPLEVTPVVNIDLALTGGSFSPNPCAIDADLTIDAEIFNNGTAPANNVLIEYYLSENTIISQSDYLVGSDYVTLSPGQYGWEHITENLSNVSGLTTGFYYVGVYFDAQGPNGGYGFFSNQLEIISTGVNDDQIVELKNSIRNHPNPFNPETTIEFSLKESGYVILEIYDVKGQKVKTLVNETIPAGNHSVIWDGIDSNGSRVSSGIYFYKMKSGRYEKIRKMILIK